MSESRRFLWHVLRLPVVFFEQRFAGDLANGVETQRPRRPAAGAATWRPAACDLLCTASFLGIVMLSVRRHAGGASPSAAPRSTSALLTLMQRVLQTSCCACRPRSGKLTPSRSGGLQSIETLKATGNESDFFAKWTGHHAHAMNSEQKLAVYQQAS